MDSEKFVETSQGVFFFLLENWTAVVLFLFAIFLVASFGQRLSKIRHENFNNRRINSMADDLKKMAQERGRLL